MSFTVHHGDCLAILQGLGAGTIDAIITDPPYSSGGAFRANRMKDTGDKYVIDQGQGDLRPDFHGDNRDQHAFGYWCALWLSQCYRTAKDGAMLAIFTDWRQLPTVTDQVQSGGWIWRGIVPWNKTEATRPQKGWYRSQCEYIVVAAKGIPASYGKEEFPALPGFYCCPGDRELVHQTQKPVDVMRWLCQLVPRGGVILDPFCGSGTTGVGAVMEGRSFIGVEMSEYYALAARKRIAEADPVGEQQSILEAIP